MPISISLAGLSIRPSAAGLNEALAVSARTGTAVFVTTNYLYKACRDKSSKGFGLRLRIDDISFISQDVHTYILHYHFPILPKFPSTSRSPESGNPVVRVLTRPRNLQITCHKVPS